VQAWCGPRNREIRGLALPELLICGAIARHHEARRKIGTPVRQLGPYQLLCKIGSGGMAEVWAARMSNPERFFAIKLLASHLAERAEYREMFLAEARLSMQLSHPNIVRVFDAVAHEHDCYMVMELIGGMTLSQLERGMTRERQAMPPVVAAYIVGEVLRALSYAHQVRTDQGSVIVHRDVSPQNVMVTTDGRVKLMDFGIARFASQETQGAFVKGKLQYMPPEQLRKETRKPTVDLYACGAILHELLDGRRFRGKVEQAKLINMIMNGEVPPLRHPIPPQLEIVRKGLLEADEGARIQTARKALGMLCRWPEYREAAADLCVLVQRYVEPATMAEAAEGSKVSSVPEGSFSGLAGLDYGHEDRSAHSDPQISPAGTYATGSELTAEELLSSAEVVTVPPPRERRGRGLVFALAGVGVAAVLGVGMLLFYNGNSEEQASNEPEPSANVAAPDTPPQPQPQPEPQPQPQPEPQPQPQPEPEPEFQPTELETGETGEASETGETGEDATGLEQPGVERVKVPVEFVANEFFFVYVKVSGRVLTLEPRQRIELPEGKHTVFLRESPDEKWKRAGRITIAPDSVYRVEMRKPAGLELVKK
jgi:serine/threonine protein kinase